MPAMAAPLLARMESLADTLLKSRGARYAGLVVGLGGIAFLVRSLLLAGDDALRWFTTVTPLQLAAALAGFGVYHLGSIVTLGPILGGPPLRVWGAAQLVKYLPVPGSAVIGIVGSTVRGGGTTRQGIAVTIQHSLLQVGGATVVGTALVAPVGQDLLGVPAVLTAVVGVAGGLGVAWFVTRHLGARTAAWLTAVTVATWAAMGVLLWLGVAQGVAPTARLSAAFAAAWVVGQLALPVPAGIGVREATLVLLLGPILGEGPALSFALGTRLVHVASDAVLSAVVLGRSGLRAVWRTAGTG
jgi:hypothetical protein